MNDFVSIKIVERKESVGPALSIISYRADGSHVVAPAELGDRDKIENRLLKGGWKLVSGEKRNGIKTSVYRPSK